MTSCLSNRHVFRGSLALTCALRHTWCVIAYFRLQVQYTLRYDQNTLLSSLETRVGTKRSLTRNSLRLTIRKILRIRYCGLASVDSHGGCVALIPLNLSASLICDVLGSVQTELKQAMIPRALVSALGSRGLRLRLTI